MTFQLETESPESIRREQEQASVREARLAMQERLAAPLSGSAGDITADLFGDGPTPLFNERRS